MSQTKHTLLTDITDMAAPESRGIEINGQEYLLVLGHDGLFVYKNNCPHLGIQLEMIPDQFLDDRGEYIVCSNHGALFEIDSGLCVAGPCNGQSLHKIDHLLDGSQVYID